jgi:hypothetical protein
VNEALIHTLSRRAWLHRLRATNGQLRYETNLLMQEELESGNVDEPFVLDIICVKDIGVFPT